MPAPGLAERARQHLEVKGRLPWSSNATFLVAVGCAPHEGLAVYKPSAGERPLWDFPGGTLHLREIAAYEVSRALGWDLVPETVRVAGPLGEGALQAFVPHDPQQHYLALDGADRAVTRLIAAFDIVINNADRKSGHVLQDEHGKLWCIDHGVSFHHEPKLRTVIWDHAGEPLPTELQLDLQALAASLGGTSRTQTGLRALLAAEELAAVLSRIEALLAAGAFPARRPDERSIPWPPV